MTYGGKRAISRVNGLELPPTILTLIGKGRWKMPSEPALLGRLFDDCGTPCEFSGPKLYLPGQMESETCHWMNLSKEGSPLRGTPDSEDAPGDIDPSKTVLIGDIGMGWDAPFALDYRISEINPSVIHHSWSEDGNWKLNRWRQISRTVESFISVLEL